MIEQAEALAPEIWESAEMAGWRAVEGRGYGAGRVHLPERKARYTAGRLADRLLPDTPGSKNLLPGAVLRVHPVAYESSLEDPTAGTPRKAKQTTQEKQLCPAHFPVHSIAPAAQSLLPNKHSIYRYGKCSSIERHI